MTQEKKRKKLGKKGFTYICISLVLRKIPCSLYINQKLIKKKEEEEEEVKTLLINFM